MRSAAAVVLQEEPRHELSARTGSGVLEDRLEVVFATCVDRRSRPAMATTSVDYLLPCLTVCVPLTRCGGFRAEHEQVRRVLVHDVVDWTMTPSDAGRQRSVEMHAHVPAHASTGAAMTR